MKRTGVLACLCIAVGLAAPLGAQRTWTLVEDLRLGGGDEPNIFAHVGPIAVTKNGSIFVVDVRPLQIKLFSPTGAFIRNVGRIGGGPGEYVDIGAMVVTPDDSVVVVAPRSGRVIVYAADGRFVRQANVAFSSWGAGPWDGYVGADGSLLESIYLTPGDVRFSARGRPRGFQRIRADGTRGDTLRSPRCEVRSPSKDVAVVIPQGERGYMSWRVPFMPVPQTAFASDGTAWCSPTDEYAVFRFRVGRPDTLHTVRLSVPAPPIPDAERAKMNAQIVRASNAADITVPKVQPTIAAIRVDASNRLWVRRTDTPDSAPMFDLYDAQGKPLGTVRSTLRWDRIPLVIGDYAYGLVLDDYDVPHVVRARMR
jgi:hypothetical protein